MKQKFLTYYILLLLNFFFSGAFAQSKTDSLQHIINGTFPDTVKATAMLELSTVYLDSDRQKAFDAGKEALAFSEKIKFAKGMGDAHNALGDLNWFAGDYTSASDHYFKALKIFEGLHYSSGMASCYRNIGWIYQGQQNFPLTLKYYFKSLELNLAANDKPRLIANYDDLGIVYKMMKRYPEALEYCQRTIRLADSCGSIRGVATGYGNLGGIYAAMGNYELSIESLKKAVRSHEQIHDYYNSAESYIALSSCYRLSRKPDLAVEHAKKALEIGQKFHFKMTVSAAYEHLAYAYFAKKDFASAYTNLGHYTALQDSIFNQNNSEQINEMSAKYESDKKEMMISSLEKDKALSSEKLAQEKNFKIYLIIFCIMIAAFAFFLFRGNQQKKIANEALSMAYSEIEIKNKDITDSINYSKRIQEATLPPPELRQELFPDSFILFKPKDIVSGDFYWYAEKNGRRLIAACDCTGHGVPGALMSMIGNNVLNQIVLENGITSASEILEQLNKEVRKALKQHENPENRDGMDIALLVLDSKNNAEFAGAQRPLWLLRNESLQEIKGTKSSIGGIQTEEKREYEAHVLPLQKGDHLYLFSDGYADQFGGPNGKKFMTRNMKDLLLKINKEEMKVQQRLLNETIESWKNKAEQVDDILVIGIHIA